MSESLYTGDSSSARVLPPVERSSMPPPPPPADGPSPARNRSADQGVQAPDSPGIDTGEQTASDLDGEVSNPMPKKAKLPPPPPPRSTLPPVRPILSGFDDTGPRTGIGSATTRWRGDLPDVETDEATDLATAQEGDSDLTDEVTKSAPSWLLSMVIHLIALLILALLASPVQEGFQNLVVELGISDQPVEDAVDLDLSTPVMSDSIDAETDAVDETLIETEEIEIFENVESVDESLIEPELLGPKKIEIAKPMFGGRSGAMRRALMAMYGATPQTQDAVKLGLAWLKRQQHSRGYWKLNGPFKNGASSENRCAATSMALLAFAGDGNTHLEGMYRREVEQGLKALVGMQDRNGFMAKDSRGNDRTYAQAQATIVLCELYGMTKDSWLREYAQRAVDYAMKAQGPDGGWRYRPGEPGDTSVTGWYVMAVQSAMAAGLEVNESKVRRISDYLDAAAVYYGAGYSYQPGTERATAAMTAEGLLCRQYLGWERGRGPMVDGINLLRADAPFDIDNHDVYYWYYATQVFHHFGGHAWKEWNDDMKIKLPALQIKEGKERGSWAPQRDRWNIGGRLFTTCLSIYCLEVYYRHMPLYDHNK